MDPWTTAGVVSLALLAAASGLLAGLEARRYRTGRQLPHLYWASGLFLVVITVALEAIFYTGYFDAVLAQAYFFLVAALVGLLSLGSAELALGPRWRGVYRAFVAASTVLVLIVVLLYPAGRSDLSSGVFTNAPLLVNLASSVLTFPAAILMAAGAILGALRTSRWRSLWTAAGIIVISLAGFLFIVSIPVTLYYAEFLGVVLLFVGFGAVPSFSARSAATRAASGGA